VFPVDWDSFSDVDNGTIGTGGYQWLAKF